jgi:hypothetical protein
MSKAIINNTIDSIDAISSITKRRIKGECKIMAATCEEINIEYTTNKEILAIFNKKGNNYQFNIPMNFPFTNPYLVVNGQNISLFFNLKSNRFKTVLKYITGLNCLCCNSLLCHDNWYPGISFDKIINQIEEYHNIKQLIIKKLLMDKIKEKYLNRDIDLDSWLFNISNRDLCFPGNSIH